MSGMNLMKTSAVAVVTLAAVVLVGIAVITGFKDTGQVNNTTANKFLTGLALFGTFMAVIVLALIGKIIIGLFTGKKGE